MTAGPTRISGDIGEGFDLTLRRDIGCRSALEAFEELAVLIITDVDIAGAPNACFEDDHWIVPLRA